MLSSLFFNRWKTVEYFLDTYSYTYIKMPVKELSDGDLKKELEQAGDKLVFVDFFATW